MEIRKLVRRLPEAIALYGLIAGTMMTAGSGDASSAQTAGRIGATVIPRYVVLRSLPHGLGSSPHNRPVAMRPFTNMSASAYAARKAEAARRGGSGVAEGALTLPPTPPTSVSINGNGEVECGDYFPSEQGLAIGDGQNPIVQVNMDCISVWSPSGTRLVGPVSLETFANLPSGFVPFNQRALYDWYNHHFIITFNDSDYSTSSYYDVAVSQNDDPTGGWYFYRIATGQAGNLNDFVRVGQDAQGVYLGSNLFPVSGGAYIQEEWLLLPKSVLYTGGSATPYYVYPPQVNGQYTDSTQPANVWSPYDNPRAEFLVGSFNFNYGGGSCSAIPGCNGLVVWALSNPFGWVTSGPNPEISYVTVKTGSNYYLPPSAKQPGGTTIDTLDPRISGEVTYGSGALYAALTTADPRGNPWADAFIYKVNPVLNENDPSCTGAYSDLCPQIIAATISNESLLNYGGPSVFFATPQPDLEGNVATVFNYSSASDYPSLAYITQRVTQAPGTFVDNGVTAKPGQQSFTQGTLQGSPNYWGYYTAVAPAGVFYNAGTGLVPATPGMGFAGQFVDASGNWATGIGFVKFTAPNQP